VRVHRLQEGRTLLTVREQPDLHTALASATSWNRWSAAAMNRRLPHHQGYGRPSGTDRPRPAVQKTLRLTGVDRVVDADPSVGAVPQ
jgi:hypothetical protein